MIEVKIRGRGGQGAVIASEILGRSLFLEGRWPQAFSHFGGERRGAPVFGFLRVDDEPILLKCQIKRADHVVLFDLALADEQEVIQELKPNGIILINTHRDINHFRKWRAFRLGLIDAGAIARSVGLGHTFNTAMLGAYARLTDLIKMETLLAVVRSTVPSKIDANLQAVQRAYDEVKCICRRGSIDGEREIKGICNSHLLYQHRNNRYRELEPF
jgi:2-oxoacid:acceptor oxidoreductase gamma subunit (pyruvate/2-ketoisovalerate family)